MDRTTRTKEAAAQATIPIGQWLGWIINLIVAEILIRQRRSRRQTSHRRVTVNG